MFQHIDAAQLLALPKAAPTRLGKGTILARYVPPWLRSTTTSFVPTTVLFSSGHPSIARRPPPRFRKREGGWRFCA